MLVKNNENKTMIIEKLTILIKSQEKGKLKISFI